VIFVERSDCQINEPSNYRINGPSGYRYVGLKHRKTFEAIASNCNPCSSSFLVSSSSPSTHGKHYKL